MLSVILGWLGPILSGPIISSALGAYKAKLAAGNSSEKLAADLAIAQAQIAAHEEELEQQSVNAEENRWFPFVRWGFAFPFMAYNAKILIWDRMLHLGHTDGLSPDLTLTGQMIVGMYFGHSALTKVSALLTKGK